MDKGTSCSQSIARHILESERLMTEGFTEEEAEQFRSYLVRVIQNLEQSVRETPSNREE